MDCNGSFDESCNLYRCSVKNILYDSDDDEPSSCTKDEDPCVKAEAPKVEEVNDEYNMPLKTRIERRRQQRENIAPMTSQRGRQGKEQATTSRRSKRCRKQTNNYPEDGMLNIVEINDDSPPRVTNWDDFNAEEGEILWDTSKTTNDVIKKDDSFCIELDEVPVSQFDIEDDLEVAIHVKWRLSANEKFHLKKSDQMKQIFQHFAKLEGVSENTISLRHNGKPISMYDTPENLKSSVIILEGMLKTGDCPAEPPPPPKVDPNQIELKVLRKGKKEKLSIFILRKEPFEVFMEKAAKEMGESRSKLSFMFDGDALDSSETPESLDLEGGECIEAFIRS